MTGRKRGSEVGEMEWMSHGFERYTARCTAYFWMVLQTVALYLLASFGHRCNAAILAVQIHERTNGGERTAKYLFVYLEPISFQYVILPVRRFFERCLGYTEHIFVHPLVPHICLWAVLFVGGIFSSGSFLKRDELHAASYF